MHAATRLRPNLATACWWHSAGGRRSPTSARSSSCADFRYLTNYNEPDAALVMVVQGRQGNSPRCSSPLPARGRQFYYGKRPDSLTVEQTLGMRARSAGAMDARDRFAGTYGARRCTRWRTSPPSDFAAQDSLTRGQQWERRFAAAHPNDHHARRASVCLPDSREEVATPNWR